MKTIKFYHTNIKKKMFAKIFSSALVIATVNSIDLQSKTKDDTPDAPAEVPEMPNSFCTGYMDGEVEVVDGWIYVCNGSEWWWSCPEREAWVTNEDESTELYCDDIGIYNSKASQVPDFPNSFCNPDLDEEVEEVDGWYYVCNGETWSWDCPAKESWFPNSDEPTVLYCDDLGIY